jgi:hypothetical protein
VTYADAYVLLALLTLATIAALLFYRHRPEAPGDFEENGLTKEGSFKAAQP